MAADTLATWQVLSGVSSSCRAAGVERGVEFMQGCRCSSTALNSVGCVLEMLKLS
jgi:hypothetical protein